MGKISLCTDRLADEFHTESLSSEKYDFKLSLLSFVSGRRQLFCFSLYLISLQMQVFYKRIRNFLFSPVSTSLHLVYNCYIIQYVKD